MTERKHIFHPLSSGNFTDQVASDGVAENNKDRLEK